MPVAEKSTTTICPEGEHIMKLVRVEEDRVTSKFSKDADKKSPVWFWIFEGRERDPETDLLPELRVMTDAKLTPNNVQAKLWKQLKPELSKVPFDEWTGDTSEVEGKWFNVTVRHESKGDKVYANAAFIKPFVKAAAKTTAKQPAKPVAPPADEEETDPLADEDAEQVDEIMYRANDIKIAWKSHATTNAETWKTVLGDGIPNGKWSILTAPDLHKLEDWLNANGVAEAEVVED